MITSAPPVSPSDGLLLGADVGGTATRVAVATMAGEVVAVAAGPAGNPNSVGLDVSAQRIRAATEQCLTRLGAAGAIGDAWVRSAVIGLAGGSRADEAFLDAALPPTMRDRTRLVSDLSIAFSSATHLPDGYVLVAGTGAVAGRIVDGELTQRRDGWGWLLGDEGSGFWLGREAVRSTLDRLRAGTEPLGALAEAVLDTAGARDPAALVRLCYTNPPIWLARFAELVSRHADDPAAAAIAERAAEHLLATLLDLRLDPSLPVVLAGSVATRPGPVRAALRRGLAAATSNPVLAAESGVIGALWLAARETSHLDKGIHDRLTRSGRRISDSVV